MDDMPEEMSGYKWFCARGNVAGVGPATPIQAWEFVCLIVASLARQGKLYDFVGEHRMKTYDFETIDLQPTHYPSDTDRVSRLECMRAIGEVSGSERGGNTLVYTFYLTAKGRFVRTSARGNKLVSINVLSNRNALHLLQLIPGEKSHVYSLFRQMDEASSEEVMALQAALENVLGFRSTVRTFVDLL